MDKLQIFQGRTIQYSYEFFQHFYLEVYLYKNSTKDAPTFYEAELHVLPC